MAGQDKNELHRQIIGFFPSYYTTLISIIQATSLAYLLLIFSNLSKGSISTVCYTQLSVTFFIIIVVWYEYMMGSTAFRWMPSIWDSIIPFFLGLAQFFLIFSIDSKKIYYWYFSFSSLCVVSFFAFLNMYRGAGQLKNNVINKTVFQSLNQFPLINKIWMATYAVVFFIFGMVELNEHNKHPGFPCPGSFTILIISSFLLLIFIGRGCYYWKRIIRENGIDSQ